MAQGVKTIDKKKFYEAYERLLNGEYSIGKAAKHIGVCHKTASKYFNMVILGQELPDTLFTDRRILAKERREKAKNENR